MWGSEGEGRGEEERWERREGDRIEISMRDKIL